MESYMLQWMDKALVKVMFIMVCMYTSEYVYTTDYYVDLFA